MKLLSEFAARWRKELDPENVKRGKEARKYKAQAKELKKLNPELLLKDNPAQRQYAQLRTDGEWESIQKRKGFKFLEPKPREARIKERSKEANKQKLTELRKKYKRKNPPSTKTIEQNRSKVRAAKQQLQEKIREKSRQTLGYQQKFPTQESSKRRGRIKELKQSLENKTKQPKLISTKYPQVSKTIPFSYLDEKFKEGNKKTFSSKYKFPKVAPGTINPPKVISSVISPTNNNNARQAFNQRLQSVGKLAMKKELLGVAAISGVIGGIALARKVRSDKNKKRGKYRRF